MAELEDSNMHIVKKGHFALDFDSTAFLLA